MRVRVSWLGTVFAFFLTGCGSLHLYNEGRDKAATAASADYEEAKLGEALGKQRAILDALEKKEIESFRVFTLARRDSALLSLMQGAEIPNRQDKAGDGFVPRLSAMIDDRLRQLDGNPARRWSDHREEAKRKALLKAEATKMADALGSIESFILQADVPECSEKIAAIDTSRNAESFLAVSTADDKTKQIFRDKWDSVGPAVGDYAAACKERLNIEKRIALPTPTPGLELALAMADVEKGEKDQATRKTDVANAKKELKAASKALADASRDNEKLATPANLTCPENADNPDLPDSISRLCKAIERAKKLDAAGIELLAEEKIARINGILAALSGVTPAAKDGDVDESLALLAAATRLKHGLELYRKSRSLPALEPLIIEKQLASAELGYATAMAELERQRLAQEKELVAAIQLEIAILGEARATLGGFHPRKGDSCKGDNAVYCDSIEKMLADAASIKGPPLVHRTAYRALALFTESYSTARDRQQTARIKLAAADYREALIRSEASVASWKAIIDTPVAQLRQYHAGGLKTETAIALLQALGIVGIATK